MTTAGGAPPGPAAPRATPGAPDAVVLAAGRGVRLGALTRSTPKVLLPVRDRPLLDYHLEALSSVGVRRVALVVHYLAEQVEHHVGRGWAFGMEATSLRQPEPLGTGDAVRSAADWVRSDPFLVCYADVYVPGETALLARLLEDDIPKIVAARVPDGGSFGRLRTREEAGELYLVDIQEKDGKPGPALVNAGLYLLPRSVLDLVAELPRSSRGEYELTDALSALVRRGGTIRVVPIEEWVDAGTEASLARANELAARGSSGASSSTGMDAP